jgi:hypothetical protein
MITLTPEQERGIIFRLTYANEPFPGTPLTIEHPDRTKDDQVHLGETFTPVLTHPLSEFRHVRCDMYSKELGTPLGWLEIPNAMMPGDSLIISSPVTIGYGA